MGLQEPEIRASSPSRPSRSEDIAHHRNANKTVIRCASPDAAVVDLDISVPHTAVVHARTYAGSITVRGLLRWASLETETGDILIEAPLNLIRIRALANTKPANIETPAVKGIEYLKSQRNRLWALADVDRTILYSRRADENPIDKYWGARRIGSYSNIEVRATSPRSIRLLDSSLPSNSWVTPTALAKAALEAMLGSRPRNVVPAPLPRHPEVKTDEQVVFSAEVRLVTTHVPVYDPEGRPVPGMTLRDFEVEEDGKPQRLAFAVSEELAFDLVLLLDLSDSTLHSREEMIRAARGFAGLARPEDRVAIYVFAENLFQVISPLTSDVARLNRLLESVPPVVGDPTTALYDAIGLSYFQESIHHSGRRTALVILSDGLDNSLAPYASQGGSIVGFRALRAAISEWTVLLYTILLPARGSVAPDQGAAYIDRFPNCPGSRKFLPVCCRSVVSRRATIGRRARDVEPDYLAWRLERHVQPMYFQPVRPMHSGR